MSDRSRSRRDFLRAGCSLLACGGVSALFPQLGLVGTALAQSAPGGYRALVCVFLDGGNDAWNLLIPDTAAEHDLYVSARNGLYSTGNTAGLAIPRSDGSGHVAGQTLPPAIALNGGQYALNPFAAELASLYNQNRLAFIANVGTLVEPITRATYGGGGARRRPPQLYSHNDQTRMWQAGISASGTSTGWGGRVAASVGLPAANTGGVPPVISISGQSSYLLGTLPGGQPLNPLVLSTSNRPATQLGNYTGTSSNQFHAQRMVALRELLDASSPHPFTQEYAAIMQRSLDLSVQLNDTIDNSALGDANLGVAWPSGNSLASQLRSVARTIRASRDAGSGINANRQVFFVRQGGYDTHDDQIRSPTAAEGHHRLLQQLSQAVAAFNQAMQNLGADNEVTLFSMSDFARTINSNGSGSDHAWGSVQFAVGGAVNGGSVYGRYPRIVLNNRIGGSGAVAPDQGECFSRGQFLPTTAVDQFAATLAQWMGVAASDLPAIFPNLDNFASGAFASAALSPTFAYFSPVIPGLLDA